jgi:Ca2+/Na+ antiporter
VSLFISGAIMMACWVVGLFFLRFWRKTADRLFAIFAVAFWMLAIERIVLVMLDKENEIYSFVFIIRFFAFVLILLAILDKNRSRENR